MMQAWLDAAMARAEFELIENDPPWFGSVPDCPGAWAVGTSEADCRLELREALESWALFGLRFGDSVPIIDGVQLSASKEPVVHG
jgi:predicted RNase H-like HicB family nuclease